MDVRAIGAAGNAASIHLAARLVETVGSARFESELFGFAHALTGCSHLTAFTQSDRAMPPTAILAMSVGRGSQARRVAESYISKHWRADPLLRLGTVSPKSRSSFALSIRDSDIDASDYRDDCYRNVALQARESLVECIGAELWRLNFYWGGRGRRRSPTAQSPEGVQTVVDIWPILLGLLRRHLAAQLPLAGVTGAQLYAARLRMLHPELTGREVSVCSLIAAGLTSEGIALELGVSINTVLTYRKRAYARVGISSQNELLRTLSQ